MGSACSSFGGDAQARKEARAARAARRAARREARHARRAARREARRVAAEAAAAAGEDGGRRRRFIRRRAPKAVPQSDAPDGDAPDAVLGAEEGTPRTGLPRLTSEESMRDTYYDADGFELDDEFDVDESDLTSSEEDDGAGAPSGPGHYRRQGSIFGEMLRTLSERFGEDPLDYDSDDEPRVPMAQRAVVGATLRHVSDAGSSPECWEEPDTTSFLIRGLNYMRDKVKVNSVQGIYAAVAADAFTSPLKIDHIMRRLRLPEPSAIGGPARPPPGAPPLSAVLPRFFVVNIQVPSYEPALWGGRTNGPGLNIVLVHELVQHGVRASPQAQGLLTRFFRNEVEASGEPSRERLKYIPRISNLDQVALEAGMSRAEKGFMQTYDGKPVMTRPQHRFYRGPGYLEVDVDAHQYAYIARKGMHAYRQHLDKMVFDSGFVLQGNSEDELPEQVLAATRIYRLDFAKQRPGPWASHAGTGDTPERAAASPRGSPPHNAPAE